MNSESIHHLLNRLGLDIFKYRRNYEYRSRKAFIEIVFKQFDYDLVIDIGANRGQFGEQLRHLGYDGRIVSYEPLSAAFTELEAASQSDLNWQVFKTAVGDTDGTAEINISMNSASSSLLPMLSSHRNAAPESEYIATEKTRVRKLDSFFPEIDRGEKNIYLKIDTQGFESQVLAGGMHTLGRLNTVQVELSLVPLYEGQQLFPEIYRFFESHGYNLVSIEPGFRDRTTGMLLQCDGIFRKF